MKYAIISVDNNPDYYNLLPLVCHSWNKLGYKPAIVWLADRKVLSLMSNYIDAKILLRDTVPGVKDSTIAQLDRLFAAEYQGFNSDDIFITADADMVIAKDIFTHEGDIVSYGYDLTGRSELPICYVKATASKWRELMGEFTIPPKAYSDKWEDFWSVDQQLLTQRAHEYGMGKITFVDRGNNNKHGLPTGRWDRHDWSHIPNDIIDVHMMRNNWDAQIQVFERLWPGEDYSFILKFKDELDGIR
jgi:hypothetical protein